MQKEQHQSRKELEKFRDAGVPRITRLPNYSDYRVEVVVDWIEFRITAAASTNFNTVRKVDGISYAEALNEGPGRSATEFLVKCQDPESWDHVQKLLDRISRKRSLASIPQVTGIEIAADFYHPDRDKRLKMLAHLYHGCRPAQLQNHRFGTRIEFDEPDRKSRGSVFGVGAWQRDVIKGFRQDGLAWTLYIGNQGNRKKCINADSISQRFYDKVKDRQAPLPLEQCRARYELTLQGQDLPFSTLNEVREFKFQSCQKVSQWFKFRRLDDDRLTALNPLARVGTEQLAQIGARRPRRRPGGGARLYPAASRANAELNDLLYERLKSLTNRMK